MPTDATQVLTALLHDLRSPLGVAHGYLRLVREGRLPTEADRERALDKTRDALGRMTQMCDDATSAAARVIESEPSTMPALAFVEAVRVRMAGSSEVVAAELAPAAMVCLHTEAARLVDTVAGLLEASMRARTDCLVRAETRRDTLAFLRHELNQVTDDLVIVSLPLETQAE